MNGDGHADIVTGADASGGPHVRVFDGLTLGEIDGFFAYDPLFADGVFVGSGRKPAALPTLSPGTASRAAAGGFFLTRAGGSGA